jgi:prophage regulatory protein
MSTSPTLLGKSDVCKRLDICERTLEKLVSTRKFPPGLKLGKHVLWAEPVVDKWLAQALAPQLTWEPPQRGRKGARPA